MRDFDVRAVVRKRLQALHADDPNTRIVEEMGIWSGSVRIDIAVINGELCGFELKSDRDTLSRLPMQAEIYSQVFDRVYLVVGSKHASKAVDLVPNWWGFVIALKRENEIFLQDERSSQRNPSINPYLVAQLLWKNEAVAVLESFNMAKGWRSRPVKDIHEKLAAELQIMQLKHCVRQMLKRRAQWLGQSVAN